MQWATDNTLGKLPGIGKPLAQLGDYGINHPLESLGTAAAAYGTFGGSLAGAGALGADAGAAGAAGADSLGAGAAEVGASGGGEAAASTASGFGGVGTDAGATGAGAGGGAASTASGFGGVGTDAAVTGSGATTGSGLSGLGKTALQIFGPAVASSLLAPKPPKTKAVSLMPDPLAEQQAAQQRLLTTMATRGRASTILTSPGGSGSLGG